MFNKSELWKEAACITCITRLEHISPFKGAFLSLTSLRIYSARYGAKSNMGNIERLVFLLFYKHNRCNAIKDLHSLVACLRAEYQMPKGRIDQVDGNASLIDFSSFP